MYFTHFVRKRASSRTTDSAGSAEGAESVESVVESVGSQILFRTLERERERTRVPHVRTPSRMEDWGNSVETFFAQTFIHTIVSDAEILRS